MTIETMPESITKLNDAPTLNILDLGCGPESIAAKVFAPILEQGYSYELSTIDINPNNKPTYVGDIREGLPDQFVGKFDLVLCSHMFEHVERHLALKVFKSMASALRKGGELWVIVPSLEWCAEKILNNEMNAAVWLCLYGGGEPYMPSFFYHNMGYTLPTLRWFYDQCGLVVRKAYQMPLYLPFKREGSEEVRELIARQNVVIGVQPNDPIAVVGG